MTGIVVLVLLPIGVLATAVTGPWLLRRSAPALMHVPRLAALVLTASILTWPLALLSIGPVLAWVTTGPVLLPGRAGEVCQQCLAAANPWSQPVPMDTGIPAVILLALPTIGIAALLGASIRRGMQRARATAQRASAVRRHGLATGVYGYRVLLIDDPAPQVFALPARHGGIVVSRAAMEALTGDELQAVLEHERAHLRQRHHLLLALATAVGHHLRWVPCIAAASEALPYYLEIAADDAARHRTGTPALASALLRLSEPAPPSLLLGQGAGALHATGPHRIGHLISPGPAHNGRWPALLITSYLGALTLLTIAVGVPYLGALATGCP